MPENHDNRCAGIRANTFFDGFGQPETSPCAQRMVRLYSVQKPVCGLMAQQRLGYKRSNDCMKSALRCRIFDRFSRCAEPSSFFFVKVFFDLLQFLLERLIQQTGAFAPWLAFWFGLSGIGGDFTTVNVLVTLFLALEFCAQFIFGHVST